LRGSSLPAGYVGQDPATWPLFNQREVAGDPNACGPTALAMVLAAMGKIGHDLGAAQALDKATRLRAINAGSPAIDLAHAARSRGLGAAVLNGSNFDELKARLASGNHVMAMIQTSQPHWVNVLGVHSEGGKEFVTIADPARGETRQMERAEFEQRWAQPFSPNGAFVNGLMGAKNQLLVLDADKKNLPKERLGASKGLDGVIDGATDLGKALHNFGRGHIKAGVGDLLSGLVQIPFGLGGALGSVVVGAGAQLSQWGDQLKDKGTLGQVVGTVVGGVGAVVGGVGQAVRAVGNAVSNVGHKISSGIKRLFGRG
jgi:hypothetical protein